MSLQPFDLSPYERFTVWRRRQTAAPADICLAHNWTIGEFFGWERKFSPPPDVDLDELTDGERCFILRKRKGLSQQAVAEAIDCTSAFITMMERGKRNPRRLLEFLSK